MNGIEQLRHARIVASLDLALGEQAKETLYLVDPGSVCGGEMEVVTRMAQQPALDKRSFMRGVIIHYKMDVEFGGNAVFYVIKEAPELHGAMPRRAFSENLASGNIQGGKERCRAVAQILRSAPVALART